MHATSVHKHSFGLPLCLTVLSALLWQTATRSIAQAQEVDFKPRWDAVEKLKRARTPENTPMADGTGQVSPVFSFDRYSSRLREICNLMELDHRRERLGKIAFDDIRNGTPCKSCRALLKEVVEQCQYRKKVVIRPTAAARPSPTAPVTPADSVVAVATTPTSTEKIAQVVPQAARYPRTDLLDATSALSAEFYERDTGEGATFESVKYLAESIMGQEGLTPAERDYFGIFTAYLVSAWRGRPDSPLETSEPSREEVRELFEAR